MNDRRDGQRRPGAKAGREGDERRKWMTHSICWNCRTALECRRAEAVETLECSEYDKKPKPPGPERPPSKELSRKLWDNTGPECTPDTPPHAAFKEWHRAHPDEIHSATPYGFFLAGWNAARVYKPEVQQRFAVKKP